MAEFASAVALVLGPVVFVALLVALGVGATLVKALDVRK